MRKFIFVAFSEKLSFNIVNFGGTLLIELWKLHNPCDLKNIYIIFSYFYQYADRMDHIPKTLPDFESAGAVWVSATDVLRKITKADCRAGRATEPLQWFPKVANDEVGMAINTPEYFELENVVLEFGQRPCTLEDIEERFLPAWENVISAFSGAFNINNNEDHFTELALKLYFDLCRPEMNWKDNTGMYPQGRPIGLRSHRNLQIS